MAVNREMLAPADAERIADMDSSESPVRGTGREPGHFASVCYHPLFLFNEHGTAWPPRFIAPTTRPARAGD